MLLHRPVSHGHSKLLEFSYKCGLDLICPLAYHHTQLSRPPSLNCPSYPTILSECHILSVLLRNFLEDEAY